VDKIRKIVSPEKWQYVRSQRNPADKLTRGATLSKLKNDVLWWEGPDIKKIEEESFNIELDTKDRVEDNENENRVCLVEVTEKEPIFNLSRFSNFDRARRAMAYVFRFIALCRKEAFSSHVLTLEELNRAEHFLIKESQTHSYSSEIAVLSNGRFIEKSNLYSLNPFLDSENLLRVNCRLENSHLSHDKKYPIIVPQRSHLADLLIMQAHKKLYHGGVSQTILMLRNKYWIPKCRSQVKAIVRRCVVCKRRHQKRVKERWAPLPSERVDTNDMRPFGTVGVDFVGPLCSKESKCYIVLFTCLRVRAIHLELVTSLESKEFNMAFQKFTSRRGVPTSVFSDNGRTFKGSEEQLTSEYNLKWNYITERAPHKGGAWERLVRSMKQPLRVALKEKTFTTSELSTLLCKIEAIVNKRPLCYVSEEPCSSIVLSPEDFLLPKIFIADRNLVPKDLGQLMKKRDLVLREIFYRWKNEFLKQQCLTGVRNNEERLKVGDIVLLDNDKRREYWPLARILELCMGRDGCVRSVFLDLKGKRIKRGIHKLYLLKRGGV